MENNENHHDGTYNYCDDDDDDMLRKPMSFLVKIEL